MNNKKRIKWHAQELHRLLTEADRDNWVEMIVHLESYILNDINISQTDISSPSTRVQIVLATVGEALRRTRKRHGSATA